MASDEMTAPARAPEQGPFLLRLDDLSSFGLTVRYQRPIIVWSKLLRQRDCHVPALSGCGMPGSHAVDARPVGDGASLPHAGLPCSPMLAKPLVPRHFNF
jgi:hypothetical protein